MTDRLQGRSGGIHETLVLRSKTVLGLSALVCVCLHILVFAVSPTAYADGLEPEALQDEERPAGNLRVVGTYLYKLEGRPVTALPNGKVLAYGIDSVRFAPNNGIEQRFMILRKRGQHAGGGVLNWNPQVWDPQLRGWKTIDPPPECKLGKPFLHTATVLPGPKILFSGGVCDEVRMADDTSPNLEYKKLSLWNGETEKWEIAPELEHGRVFHTASLLLDGNVLIVGGETDPAQVESGMSALASVELYANGKVEQMPSLHDARAQHTATVGAQGEVLVTGGYDSAGQVLASTELWNPKTREWIKVAQMNTARYSHSATLLEDGRILVAGGIGVDRRPLQSVEIWNPASREWKPSTSLPRPLRDPGAVLLDSGNLLLAGGRYSDRFEMDTWAWLWDKSSEDWLPAGRSKPSTDLGYTPTFAKNRDGSVHIFTHQTIMQWRPGAIAPESVPPQWDYHRPALAKLADGRVMTIGNIPQTGISTQFFAHIWNPGSNTWSAAGKLSYKHLGKTQALQLPSGGVIHLGLNGQNHMQCELWDSSDNSWGSCGDLPLIYVGDAMVASLLDDGRVVAITNQAEAHIFDEKTLQWTKATQKWSDEGLLKGAPIWQKKPLDILIDEENREFDISADAARFLEASPHHFPQAMLWDPAKKRWAYVLDRGTMGLSAKWLPDGCALSPGAISSIYLRNSFSLFQTAAGLPSELINPGTGISTSFLSMEVLNDGTVVVAGVPDATDATFFHRKASCAGWAADVDDWALMPGEKATPVVAPAPVPATTSQEIAPVTWRDRLQENRWLVLAVVGPIALYVLLRFIILPLVRRVLGLVISGTAAKNLDRPVPKRVSSVMRFVVYGVLLVVAIPTLPPLLFGLRTQFAEDCAITACRDTKSGLLKSVPTLEKDGALPSVPCEFVGKWQAVGQNLHKERYILNDDGTYSTQPAVSGGHTYTGYWMVQGDSMVWKHNESYSNEPDINPILSHSETGFELLEMNGWHTHFKLIDKINSKRCGS